MSWHTQPLLSYDCESTGIDVETARIVTAAIVDYGTPMDATHTWLSDVDGVEIPAEATAVHGVTTEHAQANGRPAREVVDEITRRLANAQEMGVPLVIMNAPYDLSVLDRECRRHGLATLDERIGRPVCPVIDPLVIDRAADRYRKGRRTLEALCGHYGIELGEAHAAHADAAAAVRVAVALAEKFPELQVDPGKLHGWQVTWHGRWAANFQEYLRRMNPDAKVNAAWPMVPCPAEEAAA